MGIEPIAPTLQESVAPLEHASPQYSLSAFALGLDPPSSVSLDASINQLTASSSGSCQFSFAHNAMKPGKAEESD